MNDEIHTSYIHYLTFQNKINFSAVAWVTCESSYLNGDVKSSKLYLPNSSGLASGHETCRSGVEMCLFDFFGLLLPSRARRKYSACSLLARLTSLSPKATDRGLPICNDLLIGWAIPLDGTSSDGYDTARNTLSPVIQKVFVRRGLRPAGMDLSTKPEVSSSDWFESWSTFLYHVWFWSDRARGNVWRRLSGTVVISVELLSFPAARSLL